MEDLHATRSFIMRVGLVGLFLLAFPSYVLAAPDPINISIDGFVLSGAYTVVAGQPTGSGQFGNGGVGAYAEGACVPMLVEVTNTAASTTGNVDFRVIYDYEQNGAPTAYGILALEKLTTPLVPSSTTDLNNFAFNGSDLTTVTQFGASNGSQISAVIAGPFSGSGPGIDPALPTDNERHYNITLQSIPGDVTVHVLLCGRLDADASEFSGASMHASAGNGNGNGNGTVQIQPDALLELPSLTITKTVVGGSATSSQWTFNIAPNMNGTSTLSIPQGQSSVVIPNVNPDGVYTITENSGPADYNFTSGSGTNCSFNGSTASASLFASTTAQNATCIFTNTFDPLLSSTTTLTVTKQVINDDGGTAVTSSFSLFIDNTQVQSGVPLDVTVGDHFVSETPDPNYSGVFSGDCNSDGMVTISAGQALNCTISNNDVAVQSGSTTGTLIVIKTVVNDGGGTAVASDFALAVFSSSTQTVGFMGDASGTAIILNFGNYSVIEDGVGGYVPSFSADCFGSIAPGETKTCTVTNDDPGLPPPISSTGTLIVIKTVINNDGGQATASAFTMNVTGTNPTLTSFPGNASGTSVTLDVGPYSVLEVVAPGYDGVLSPDCSGTIAAGETKTCTVTNDDIPQNPAETGTLIVIKTVINNDGGQATADAFTMNVTGTNPTLTSFPGNASGTTVTLDAGSYAVSESSASGYTTSYSEDCSGTIAADETRTCDITNNDIPDSEEEGQGTLIVIKTVINDNGGSRPASDFTLTVTGTNVSQSSFQGDANGTIITLDPGSYQVNEADPANYAKSLSADCSGTIAAGETKTCTVTNDDQERTGGSGTTIFGGGGGGGNNGGGNGSSIPTTPTPPPGEVLGATDEDPGDPGDPGVPAPTPDPVPPPRVLGATDEELPRTGLPATALFALLLPLGLYLPRRSR